MNKSLKLCGEVLLVSTVVGLAFIAGAFMSTEGELLERANIEGHCKAEPRFNAYIAQASDGWHCFKENIDNGKLSRTAIVL
jgi:hypothetical protein